MFKYKIYLKFLFLIFVGIFITASLYLYTYSKSYPLPVLSRISLDSKLKFIKENVDINTIDTIIVGSSIGLENISGASLEESSASCKAVLNFSGSGLRASEVEQILELTTVFPNLKRVIYSAQFSDFSGFSILDNFQPTLIKDYISNTLTLKEKIELISITYQNIYTCIKWEWEWSDKHMSKNKFGYLGFDHTGSVPMHIYGKDIIRSRWNIPHSSKQDDKSYLALDRIAKKMESNGIKFYFIMEPYRIPLVEKFKHVRPTMQHFEKNAEKIVIKHDGNFLNLHEKLQLNDNFFADRSHLNDKGSVITGIAIGEFIDDKEKK